jgi:hypothetical protein
VKATQPLRVPWKPSGVEDVLHRCWQAQPTCHRRSLSTGFDYQSNRPTAVEHLCKCMPFRRAPPFRSFRWNSTCWFWIMSLVVCMRHLMFRKVPNVSHSDSTVVRDSVSVTAALVVSVTTRLLRLCTGVGVTWRQQWQRWQRCRYSNYLPYRLCHTGVIALEIFLKLTHVRNDRVFPFESTIDSLKMRNVSKKLFSKFLCIIWICLSTIRTNFLFLKFDKVFLFGTFV